MDTIDPTEIVTVELDCEGWTEPYARDITRRQLGELLLQLDDMAYAADMEAEQATETAPSASKWPTPEQAYANAPSIDSESQWINQAAAVAGWEEDLDREWHLRHAALRDRIALAAEPGEQTSTATDEADATAVYLLDTDGVPRGINARAYVRQQYARWAKNQ
ncbi:hypothetical protein [Streptomyces halobius]|uniref:Lsr2 protein n=1 Tax=Streptomyces halobius TaxID=2879846 RepID=A0ABY4MA16_9ACTN|nr:hypothetical protein [Streptomyces halobius]UQA93101.1 hypothetical protein K9S39_15740 [Streptomyces halobius]